MAPVSAPCAVQSVLNTLNCSTNILTISWAAGSMPVNYSATALDGDGTVLRCMTEDSSCTMTNLQCGQQYTVTVKAISSTCEGHSSVPEIVNSGKFDPTEQYAIYKYRKCSKVKDLISLDSKMVFCFFLPPHVPFYHLHHFSLSSLCSCERPRRCGMFH